MCLTLFPAGLGALLGITKHEKRKSKAFTPLVPYLLVTMSLSEGHAFYQAALSSPLSCVLWVLITIPPLAL